MLPHASRIIAAALVAGLAILIGTGAVQAKTPEPAAANDLRVERFRE